MNRYFVFKKVRNVNMTNKAKVNTEMIHTQIEELENKETKETKDKTDMDEPKTTVQPKKIRKNKKKVVIEKNKP